MAEHLLLYIQNSKFNLQYKRKKTKRREKGGEKRGRQVLWQGSEMLAAQKAKARGSKVQGMSRLE